MNKSNNAVLKGNTYQKERTLIGNTPQREKGLYFSTIVAGIFAAVAMAFVAFLLIGTEMNPATIMFVKYVVLIPVILWAISRQKKVLGPDYRFVKGIRQGGLVSLVAAVSLTIINAVAYNMGINLETGSATEPASYLGSSFINGGVVLMECFVLGMIITFIYLQFIKRGRPGEESLSDTSV